MEPKKRNISICDLLNSRQIGWKKELIQSNKKLLENFGGTLADDKLLNESVRKFYH